MMKTSVIERDVVVMCSEPLPDVDVDFIDSIIDGIETERELAAVFAQVENKAWWVEDCVYDYEEGAPDYHRARAETDRWFALVDKLKAKIFSILQAEGAETTGTTGLRVLEPFMNRNGYRDGSGWWIRANL